MTKNTLKESILIAQALTKLEKKYERKLKRVRKEVFEQGEVVGFKKASEIKHYCESCGKLLKERR